MLALATYCFAIQIYADFSAYSDIALGAARVMGITLMENFDRPYLSASLAEFWKRWHISLSTWFRDYLYIPLGGSRVSRPRWCLNIMIVFLISGLWHGANWTFVVWGALHGFYLIFGTLTKPARNRLADLIGFARFPRLHRLGAVILTFNLTAIAWVFFRADSTTQSLQILRKIFSEGAIGIRRLADVSIGPIEPRFLGLSVWLLIAAGIVHLTRRRGNIMRSLDGQPLWLRWSACYAVIFTILLLGTFGSQSFIYFQF